MCQTTFKEYMQKVLGDELIKEDYCDMMEYLLFKNANKTILGDVHQSINPFMNVGDYSNITRIFEKDNTYIINLTKSYRWTMEITKFSRGILNNKVSGDYVERRGEKPTIIGNG